MEETVLNQALQNITSGQLQNQSQTTPTLNSLEISVYKGNLSKKCVTEQAEMIMNAFPKMTGMIPLLKERLKANGFNDDRLVASVNHVIDNYTGFNKEPNIADFIQYDKLVKVYTWNESVEIGQDKLVAVDIDLESPRWAYKDEAKFYQLKLWEDKTK